MKELEDRILKDGVVLPGDVLKVGSFLNQQIDTNLLKRMAQEIKEAFPCKVDKVLTIEASGLPFATAVAMEYDIPMTYAKKHKSSNMSGDCYTAEVFSFTHQQKYTIALSKDYLKENENVLIVDDFLATGNAIYGLMDIVEQAKVNIVGCGIQIEKGFQGGGDQLRKKGIKVESLAIIESLEPGNIKFR